MSRLEVLRVIGHRRDAARVQHVADADADFELAPDGDTDASALLAAPSTSLYALDRAHGGVTFVEAPPDRDLLAAPFLHAAQREHARRVVRVPFAVLHEMAGRVPAPPAPPIVVHSVGRCGSTLVSTMLRAVPGVASLAEPDVLTAVESEVATGGLREDDAVAVLRSALRLAAHGLAPAGSRPAVKPRSEVVWIARLLDRAVPDARTLFMYRDARRVIESYLRVLGRPQHLSDRLARLPVLDAVMARRHARRVAARGPRMQRFAYVLGGCTPLDVEMRGRWGKFLIQWLAKVHHYMDLRDVRPDVAALRYEDLVAAPEAVARALFAHCGLPTDALPAAVATMSRDSQKGTRFEQGARDAWRLSARDEREMARTFRECTSLAGPDAVLPGTLTARETRPA